MWPRPAVAEYRQVTYRKGAVSSARFTPDGQSFVYSASWEGQPYAAFLGRPESPDVRDLQLEDARILSISRAGDMAVLFGPQNIERAFGVRTLARIADGRWRTPRHAHRSRGRRLDSRNRCARRYPRPGGGRPWTVEFPVGTTVHEARAAWSLRVSPDGNRVAFFEGPVLFDSAPQAMITVIDRSGQQVNPLAGLGRHWIGLGAVGDARSGSRPTRPGQARRDRNSMRSRSRESSVRCTRAPDWLVLHDISTDGRVLLSRNSIRINAACQAPGKRVSAIWGGWWRRSPTGCHPTARR